MELLSAELICSVLPAILLVLFVKYRDRGNPEPWMRIVKGVFFGVLSALLTLAIDEFWCPLPQYLGLGWIYEIPVVRGIFTAFYEAAIPEETAKLFMLWLLLRKSKDFDEHMDGIVYAVCIGMGFAGYENILYVCGSEDWEWTALTRAFLAVPGHYIDAVLMGFFYSIVHFQPARFGKYRHLIWTAPVVAHGIYDSICFVGDDLMVGGLLIFVPLVWFCVKMHKFCFARMRSIEFQDEDKRDMDIFMQTMKK